MPLLIFFIIGTVYLSLLGLVMRSIFLVYFSALFVQVSLTQKMYALLWGMKFDLAIASILAFAITGIAYLSVRGFKKANWCAYLYIIAIAFIVFTMSADLMYFLKMHRHITFEIRDVLVDFVSLLRTGFGTHPLLSISALLFIAINNFFLIVLLKKFANLNVIPTKWYKVEISIFVVLVFSFFAYRGDLLRPIRYSPHSVYEINNEQLALIAFNDAYASFFYLFNQGHRLEEIALPKMKPQEIKRSLQALYPNRDHQLRLSHLRKRNVVVIMLESWPATAMKSYGYALDTTPNFDHLRQLNFSTAGMIANGHCTPAGVFATFCSSQNPLGGVVAESNLIFFPYRCLPKLLHQQGWSTAFFEGTYKDTAGVSSLAQKIGFTSTYGQRSIHTAQYPPNRWGYQDPDEYAFVLKKLKTMHEPFLIGINTTSTHDNMLPPNVKAKFGMNTARQQYLSILHFADQSLSDFIKAYKKVHFKYPTLFVIEADHTSGLSDVITTTSPFQEFFIPFLMMSTSHDIPELQSKQLASQRDIAPTIMDYLSGNIPWFTGKSLLSADKKRFFSDYFSGNGLGWIEGGRLVTMDLSSGALHCYDWKQDPHMDHPLSCDNPDKKHIQEGLAFTIRNQTVLFQGKLGTFFKK